VGAFLDRWLADSVKTTVRPKTLRSYTQLVELHLKPGLGHIQLAKLNPQETQRFLNRKLESGSLRKPPAGEATKPKALSPRTVQYLHSILRHALGVALRWGLVARNVATLVNPPRVARKEVVPLAPAEAKMLLDALKGDRLEALYSVALAVGLRQGEALGLRWLDVDLDAGTLNVRVALQRIDGKVELVEPKTDRSRRAIALPAVAVEALRRHQVRQKQDRLVAGSRWKDALGLVFTSTIGTPLDSGNVTHYLQRKLKDAGLPRQRFHDLRHCCASLLLAQGVHPRVVMELLGHSQIALTMNTYSHVMPALKSEAAGKMDAALRHL
jgi:integrase